MGYQEVEDRKKVTDLGDCVKAKQMENTSKGMNRIDREQSQRRNVTWLKICLGKVEATASLAV